MGWLAEAYRRWRLRREQRREALIARNPVGFRSLEQELEYEELLRWYGRRQRGIGYDADYEARMRELERKFFPRGASRG